MRFVIKSIVFCDFSLLAHGILHSRLTGCCMASCALFPLWLAGRVSPCLLLDTWVGIAHKIISSSAMHALSLRHHASKTTSIRQHFTLGAYARAACKIRRYQILLFVLGGMVICLLLLIIGLGVLTLNIYGWLGSDSVFWRSWAGLLGVSPVFLVDHLPIVHAVVPLGLAMWNASTH